MRIVVAGLAATYPLGGVFWDYLQYVQGFADLGHEVLYLEDTGAWCYDPAASTMIESGGRSAVWLSEQVERFLPSLRECWFFRDATGVTFGVAATKAREFCQTAEFFLNVSGATMQRDQFPNAHTAYLDSDPMYSQVYVSEAIAGSVNEQAQYRLDVMQSYDSTFTFGENVGRAGCLVPSEMFNWRPTRQPVLVDRIGQYRVPVESRIRRLRTIGSWEVYKGPLIVGGRRYFGKRRELLRFRGLARQSPVPLELALSGDGPFESFAGIGWSFADPSLVSASAESYLRFLASSFAEWSVAKHAYVASKSGWFSGRTALYLALGVPAIVQDTDFSKFLPTGSGLHAFSTEEEALRGIEDIVADYERNCIAALEIAHDYFDAKKVLFKLLDDAFSKSPKVHQAISAGPLP